MDLYGNRAGSNPVLMFDAVVFITVILLFLSWL